MSPPTTAPTAGAWTAPGQLGDGGTANRGRPTLVAGGLRYIEVYAGGNHTCGITTTNRAYCWGANGSGQLGDGTTTERHQPVAVANGSFVQIRAGYRHTCAVNASNVAFCWGDNTWGQLGDNSKTRRLKPVRLAGTVHFLRLTAGAIHSCGIATDNHGYCWGKNGFGELGDGTAATRLKPTAVAGGRSWRQIWAGSSLLVKQTRSFTCGVTTDKHAFCWGDNAIGQLGVGNPFGSPVPEAVSGGRTFAAITAGLGHACAITTSDLWNTSAHAYCWGNDANNRARQRRRRGHALTTPARWQAACRSHGSRRAPCTPAPSPAPDKPTAGARTAGDSLGNGEGEPQNTSPMPVVGP